MTQEALAPYVPRLVMNWLRDTPEAKHQRIDGTLVFADISGFTELTERLASRGTVGAEEMGDILNGVFEPLLAAAYDQGAGLLTWGGDAVLLLFDGDDHCARACAASFDMQQVLAGIGTIRTAVGRVFLRMSVGIHAGPIDALLVGNDYRQLVVTGPTASGVAHMEKIADAGEIVVSGVVAVALGLHWAAQRKGQGWLLESRPDVAPRPAPIVEVSEAVDLRTALCPPIATYLMSGAVEPEHRHITVGFVEFSGVDGLLEQEGAEALADAVEHLVVVAQRASSSNDVTLLGVDINTDGGKLILVSGAPTRVGEDETRVLSAVRSLLDSGTRLTLRAGVNNGRVFAGDYGPPFRRTYSIAGDYVNLAARLMAKAEPDQIVASPEVVARSRTRFRCTDLEPFQVKGKAELIRAISVGAFDSTPEKSNDQLPIVGRDPEMTTLLSAWQRAEAGLGQVVEVVADPGVGKTRLIQELADRTGASVLWAAGDVYGRGTPYQPMQRLLRSRLGLDADTSPEEVAARLTRTLAGLDPRILAWAPLIGLVAGVEVPETPEVAALDETFRKNRLEIATSTVLGELYPVPTVLVFEDVHFMDDATRDLAARLAADAMSRPWLVILTRRSGFPTPLRDELTVSRIALQPLREDATRELLASASTGKPLLPHAQAALVARSGGNPLFLRELSHADVDLESLPDTVEGVIAARIDRLTPTHRRLLRTAAVLGPTVDESILFRMIEAADPAELREFLLPERPGRWRFAHELVREVAYAGLPFRRRSALHAVAGEVIEGTLQTDEAAHLLSLHFAAAGRYEKAWKYSVIAGHRARSSYANADAALLFDRALAAARRAHPPAAEVAKVAEALLDCAYRVGQFDRAADALSIARRAARGDNARLAVLALKAAWISERAGALERATRWAAQGRHEAALVDGKRGQDLRARCSARTARVYYLRGRSATARRWALRALEQSSTDLHAVAEASQALSWVESVLGDFSEIDPALRAYEAYVELGDLHGQGLALIDQGVRAYFQGRWAVAVAFYAAGRDALERSGNLWNAAIPAANIAEILLDQGDYTEAREILESAMEVWRAAGARPEEAFGKYLLGRLAGAQGDFARAFSLFSESRDYFAETGETREVVLVDALIAQARLESGDIEGALLAAEDIVPRLEPGDAATPLVHRVLGRALVALGKGVEGEAAIRRALAEARARDAQHEVAFALAALDDTGFASAEEKDEQSEIATRLGLLH